MINKKEHKMKKLISLVFLAGCGAKDKVAPVAPVSVAETEDVTTDSESAKENGYPQALYIDTLADLPACGDANARQLIYVVEDASFRACDGDWKVIEITKTETIVKEAIAQKSAPVVIPEGFGTWSATNVVASNGAILSQVSVSEIIGNTSKFTVTNGVDLVITEDITNYRLAPTYSKAPFLNGVTPIFSVSFIEWLPTGIHVRIWQDDAAIHNFWDVILTRK